MSGDKSGTPARLVKLAKYAALSRGLKNLNVYCGSFSNPSTLVGLLGRFLFVGVAGLSGAAYAGTVEDLVSSKLINPAKYQVIWEDFNIIPPIGLANAQTFGWAIYGAGSATTQVGAALLGGQTVGEGNGTIVIFTGAAQDNETIIASPWRLSLGLTAYVTRLQPTRQDYVLAVRIGDGYSLNSRQFVGLDSLGQPSVEHSRSLPGFYWNGFTWTFLGGGAGPIYLDVPAPQSLVFNDLLASSQGGVLRLYVNGVLVSTSTAPLLPPSDCYPAIGVKTKGPGATYISVDYFFFATERNPT